jgi:uncharacterized membrane-anchored protein YjiN (DUF445 family)
MVVTAPSDRPSDREVIQRRALRRNRAIATALLLIMAGGFLATSAAPDAGLWVSLIRATTEAGVIGGLADWFAITALFRRPLGLPIPHTAILPRNKNRIGEGLGAFLERHFLTEELVLARLRSLDVAQHVADWLADPRDAEMVADKLAVVLPHLTSALDDEELRRFTGDALGIRLRDVDAAPLVGKVLGLLTAGGYHAAVVDRSAELAAEFLERNAQQLEESAAEGTRRRWWIPAAVNRQVARAIIRGVRELLEDLRTPDSKLRRKVLDAIDESGRDLARSPEHRARFEAAKHALLDRPEVQAWLGSVWDQIRDSVVADIGSPRSHAREGIATACASIGRALRDDANMRARLNSVIETVAVGLLPWRRELGRFVADVVRRWDETVLVQRMELAIGADLQYVRFTGTLVGATIGCLLFLLPRLAERIASYVAGQ